MRNFLLLGEFPIARTKNAAHKGRLVPRGGATQFQSEQHQE